MAKNPGLSPTLAELDPGDLEDSAHLASPLALLSRVTPNFHARPHQKFISDKIVNAVGERGSKRIAVSVPPQYGKSTVTSIGAPMWWIELHSLGLVKGGMVGLVSYEDKLAMSWSTKVRREFAARPDFFETDLRTDSKAAGFWETEQGGGIIAVGINGSIVGRPISLLVIDDPTKNYEQANSEKHREMVWEFWQTVGIGRLQPWTVVIVTMTRWREDDIIGRLTSDEFPGDPAEWDYIRIPAVADPPDSQFGPDPLGREPGTPLLRPQADQTIEQATRELESVKANISTYHWNTLWLQSPVDPEGTIFSPQHWRYYSTDALDPDRYLYRLPDALDLIIMTWDMTFKETKGSDWVVGIAIGAKGPDRYVLDLVRGHWGFSNTCNQLVTFAERTRSNHSRATTILVEDKANGTAVVDHLKTVINGLHPVTPEGSKEARAWACEPLHKGGNLYLPSKELAPWVESFVKECADFPTGTNDDQVDAFTQGIIYLQSAVHEEAAFFTGDGSDLTRLSEGQLPSDLYGNNVVLPQALGGLSSRGR